MQTVKRTLADVIRFLDEKGCLTNFLINGGTFDKAPTCGFITAAFCWKTTLQGEDYWNDIDNAYRKWFLEKVYDKFDLYRFLESKGALTDYLKYSNCEPKDPKTFISGAFCWKTTRQGYNYWASLNKEWMSIITEEDYAL